jgi:hypothetical protein
VFLNSIIVLEESFVKLIHYQILLLSALTITPISFYSLASDVESYAQKPVKAEIQKIGDGGQALRVLEKKSSGLINVADRLKVITAKDRFLRVPPGRNQPLGHLRFFTSSGRIDPLVQVGPNKDETVYYFPCYALNGKFMFVWGLGDAYRGDACHGIKVGDKGMGEVRSQTFPLLISQIPDRYARFANGLLTTKDFSNFLISQADSSKVINISPGGSRITMIQVDSSAERIIIDALVGNAKITTESQPEGITLEEGRSYNSSKPEPIGSIEDTLETRWAISVFVDPKNWTESVAPQISTLQQQSSLQKFIIRRKTPPRRTRPTYPQSPLTPVIR